MNEKSVGETFTAELAAQMAGKECDCFGCRMRKLVESGQVRFVTIPIDMAALAAEVAKPEPPAPVRSPTTWQRVKAWLCKRLT